MDQIPFQFLFLATCIGGVAYLMRNNFYGTAQKLYGVFVPRPVITIVISVILGFFIWTVTNLILSQI